MPADTDRSKFVDLDVPVGAWIALLVVIVSYRRPGPEVSTDQAAQSRRESSRRGLSDPGSFRKTP